MSDGSVVADYLGIASVYSLEKDTYVRGKGKTSGAKAGGVSNETLDLLNKTSDYMGWGFNLWGDASKYTLASLQEVDVATSAIKGIAVTAKMIGYTGMAISLGVDLVRYKQTPTWGNAARIGVDGFAIGVSVLFPGPGTAVGIFTMGINATGALDDFYNYLDVNQTFYNNTGCISLPLIPTPIIKIK